MREKGRLSCARCSASFPNVSILKCDNTILGITLTMCKTCHKRFHPTCTSHISATRPGDRMCDRCLHCQATLVCPQCSGQFQCAQFCEPCNIQIHDGLRESHLDHVRTMPS
ncbi:uncharacterized protein LOC132735178 isoform X2 [Ruditapes philippinarum]|uniref:uncharacterized protein LOC132735178 isoform X2 n=1 Tax=Ruditapes philippinarum TaxID=129788 RepID=UPI00295A7327|nr:uncharacterized protein LOC132735178 isoform X2 [Ruditapes philippinarum]